MSKNKKKELLHSIQVEWAFKRIRIDLVGPLLITKQNNYYIILAINYLTRWLESKAIPDTNKKL